MTNSTAEKLPVQFILPAVNIIETPKAYIVTLDIPGAVKEKITANIENNSLVVVADIAEYSTSEKTESAKQYKREFTLATDIDVHTVDAQYDLGVLTVSLNKKEQYLPKSITIN